MKKLDAIQGQLERLDDPGVGLTALHGDLAQSRLMLEQLQTSVTALHKDNRQVHQRQDRIVDDLNDARRELRQLMDLADVLRRTAPPEGTSDAAEESTETDSADTAQPSEPQAEASRGVTAPDQGHSSTPLSIDSQGGTMENTEPGTHSENQDLALKSAIEAAYRGASTGQPAVAAPQPSAGAEDPLVAHGVLLIKAAGVASVELIAHRDTWEWLAALAAGHSHFRTPPSVENIKEGREGRVLAVLSGRSLIALLIELWNTRSKTTPLQGDYAMAMNTYDRIAGQLVDLTERGETIRIVLDDGLPGETGD
jgi:hypothetical protein